MINGMLKILGDMTIEGEELTGAFVECSTDDLKKGRDLFAEDVSIIASQPSVEVDAAVFRFKCIHCSTEYPKHHKDCVVLDGTT